MEIRTKRVYDDAEATDGVRILIDRLWPRGVSKERAKIDFWARDVAPSHELRKWYQHDPKKWPEFERRYFEELDRNPEGIARLEEYLVGPVLTVVFGSKEPELNNATAFANYLGKRGKV